MGPEPEGWPITSLAITFCVEEQFNAGRPGREATPAKQGVRRVPSGGKLESGAEVRTMIQCWSSQLFPGKVQERVAMTSTGSLSAPRPRTPACRLKGLALRLASRVWLPFRDDLR